MFLLDEFCHIDEAYCLSDGVDSAGEGEHESHELDTFGENNTDVDWDLETEGG